MQVGGSGRQTLRDVRHNPNSSVSSTEEVEHLGIQLDPVLPISLHIHCATYSTSCCGNVCSGPHLNVKNTGKC